MKNNFFIFFVFSLSLSLLLGCVQKKPDLLRIAEQFKVSYNSHDVAAAANLYSEDATFEVVGEPEIFRGRKAIEESYSGTFRAFPDCEVEFTNIVASGDYICIEAVSHGLILVPL